jgi:uncharacterized protein
MSQQANNIDLVKAGYAAFSAGDMETVMGLYDDNIEWVQPGNSAISGSHHGKGELGHLLARLGEHMTELRPRRFLADGDTVVVFSDATIGDENSPDVEVFTLRDGMVVHAQTYGDTALMERIFGKKQVSAG